MDDGDIESFTDDPCPKCNENLVIVTCPNCGGEGSFDLYEEDPLWYEPGDYGLCEFCEGKEVLKLCLSCARRSKEQLNAEAGDG